MPGKFWNPMVTELIAARTCYRMGQAPETPFKLPAEARERFGAPDEADLGWFLAALGDVERKWLVARLALDADTIPDSLLEPLLDAGIDEPDPSFNRQFIDPCMRVFGARRVNEHLLDVWETGDDLRKAGAIRALYWAQVSLTFKGDAPEYSLEHATPESREEFLSLTDIWLRKHDLNLKTFVFNEDLDVRRSVIPHLDLDPDNYAEADRPLVEQAIRIARESADEYIRHRVEVQLGNEDRLMPIPPRRNPEAH